MLSRSNSSDGGAGSVLTLTGVDGLVASVLVGTMLLMGAGGIGVITGVIGVVNLELISVKRPDIVCFHRLASYTDSAARSRVRVDVTILKHKPVRSG